MPLPKPALDNRRFDQLVGEGVAIIPRRAPRWTDHNASDPGIMLVELGAWLAEQNIYRFDRASEQALRTFVRLVGVEPAPAAVATTVVTLELAGAAAITLPARMQLATVDDTPRFETTTPVALSPAMLVSALSRRRDSAPFTVIAFNPAGRGFDPFGVRPRKGSALYLGFDRALDSPSSTWSLHAWSSDWRADAAVREALIAEVEFAAARVRTHCQPTDDWRRHYRVRTVWEFYAGNGIWRRLQDVVDETRALSLSGFVRFAAPTGHAAGGVAGLHAGQFFVRCRIVSGRFECPPRIVHFGFNAVACEHAVSHGERLIGSSRGHATARFALAAAPVVPGTVRMRLDNGSGDVQADWNEAPDFDRAGPHDRAFVLESESDIVSGDGLRGAIIPAGYRVHVSCRTGGDVQGNLAAESLVAVPMNAWNVAVQPSLAQPLAVQQPFQAAGGAPRETLSAAQSRAFQTAAAVEKAVTLEDIERHALATPGVPVARVRAVANHETDLPCYPAPGITTVIVIPPCPRPRPLPSRALLDAVERHLEPRRLVTSEIRAIAPRYRRISVRAALQIGCDLVPGHVKADAETRLRRFLDPLDGGPNGGGWLFGRTVYRAEVMALLADTPGVTRVTGLSLESGSGCCGGQCDNVELCADELVISGRHRLSVAADGIGRLRRSTQHECE